MKGIIPIRKVQEVLVIEADQLEDDVLERFQPAPKENTYSGKSYDCEIVITRSFDAGMEWFSTRLSGKLF